MDKNKQYLFISLTIEQTNDIHGVSTTYVK